MLVFLDTNIFLHCLVLQEIDFAKVLKCKNFTLVIPRIIIKELDEKKYNQSSKRLRNRAIASLKTIELLAEDSSGNLKIDIMMDSQNFDFSEYNLDYKWNDDHLIMAALYKQKSDKSNVVIVSQDLAMRLKCKQLGLKAIGLPSEYQLPPEIDPIDKENKKLLKKIQEIENALPKLEVVFSETDENKKEFSIKKPIPIDKTTIDSKIKEAIDNIPHYNDGTLKMAPIQEILKNPSKSIITIPSSEINRFKEERRVYPEKVQEFEIKKHEHENIKRMSFEFSLKILNFGKAPADDIDLKIHFPDGFKLYEEEGLPSPPEPPEVPELPTSEIGILARNMLVRDIMPNNRFYEELDFTKSNFDLKKTNSYELKDFFVSIKHNFSENLPKLILVFEHWDLVKSFSCDYELRVGNLPEPVKGEINFIIKKID